MELPLNVLGGPLNACSHDPVTGWFRDGCCNTDENDHGSHTVCAVVTQEFLVWLQEAGNDLITPAPQYGFRGLRPGDSWCICAASWRDAHRAGKGCAVHLESTHKKALEIVPIEELMVHAVAPEA
ncbi:MAG: DUF2237 domain-containing protein [Proteobacteria bacterium]|nr:DUF2237 domain-containing protein [Pseudomonadota bacterium]